MFDKLSLAALLLASASVPSAAAQDLVNLSLPNAAPSDLFSGSRSKEALVAQVLLDRARFSPGAIDGIMGGNTARAIRAFQRANGMDVTGKLGRQLLSKLLASQSGDIVQRYTITQEDVNGPFVQVPPSMEAQAKLDTLAYESAAEKLAEKFHMSQAFLEAMNPNADFGSKGTEITVVTAGSDRLDAKVARIEVDKKGSSVRAYDESGKLVARYPATVGSDEFPSPRGSMQVKAVAPDAKYYFSPEGRQWGPDKSLTIAAGPNNPIGEVWIDLSKEGYGIHGIPEPSKIGKTSSHGCVRLTNWDAEELSRAVSQDTKVLFV